MNFLENIFRRLAEKSDRTILQEIRNGQIVSATGRQLLAAIRTARTFFTQAGLRKGERCALLAPNGIPWAAADLAAMAEGLLVVPLYARQAPSELVAILKDCAPSLLCCGGPALRDGIAQLWPDAPPMLLLDEILGWQPPPAGGNDSPRPLADSDPVTIIYTSGTSGEAKGVILNVGNLNHMLRSTTDRLNLLIGPQTKPEGVFHYLPFCFAGSWILLLSCLSRNSVLTLSTDLTRLAEEIRLAAPEYFLNVPALLERVRTAIEEQMHQRGGLALRLYQAAKEARSRQHVGEPARFDPLRLALANALLFPAIRKRMSRNLKALICGSAPLAPETQLFFMMIGLPVLQVYGLTETTAICTMDHPQQIQRGWVGPAIDGMEMTLGAYDEILVRGPNVFPGYWNRPQATAEALRDGWFHTGDQGEVNGAGNWRITGRLKNLVILSSGHNVAPEPLEEKLLRALPGAQQVLLVGNGRSYLTAIMTGDVEAEQVQATLEAFNSPLPHYQRIYAFHLHKEPFSVENGLLTVNGKMKREVILARFLDEIEQLYQKTRG